ncbi:MAG: hypothetical protein CMN76_04005 [Spirochaetaceae bacterium]|nr:hypothetical protein [Spirochaetaceae bacterium]|tara:strand:- start:264403 stop:265632 length:1230 start_codon:yes stop_codon:yes gene_type:complete
MFRLDIRCGDSPVQLKDGKALSLEVGDKTRGSGSGIYRFGPEGWKQHGRPPVESGTLFRIPLIPDTGEKMRHPVAMVAVPPNTRNFTMYKYNRDALELYIPHGKRFAVKVGIARHETRIIVLEGDSSRPVVRHEPLSFKSIDPGDYYKKYRVYRRYPLSQSQYWPDRDPPEGCYLSIVTLSYWKYGTSTSGDLPLALMDTPTDEPDSGILPFYNDSLDRECYSKKQLARVHSPLRFREYLIDEFVGAIKMDPLQPVTEPTEVVLLATYFREPDPEYRAFFEADPASKSVAYAAIDDLGFWNLDAPRKDLSCVTGEVDSDEIYMVSIIATEKFIQNSSWFEKEQFEKTFPRGERFRVLVVSGDKAGASAPAILPVDSGPNDCLDVGKITLRRISEADRSSPEAFRRAVGL